MATTEMPLSDEQHKACGKALFNFAWTLLKKPDRSVDDDDMMVHACHAMYLHWSKVGEAVNFARAEWQLSRVYAVLGRAETALHHATRCLDICRANDLGGFDLAFAYEALARASAVAAGTDEVRRYLDLAHEAAAGIADDEDREILLGDLRTVPG